MNERSSLDIPGAEIYVGVARGFISPGWHSFAFHPAPRCRPRAGSNSCELRPGSPKSAPRLRPRPLAERSRHARTCAFMHWRASRRNYSPLSGPGPVLRFVRGAARRIMSLRGPASATAAEGSRFTRRPREGRESGPSLRRCGPKYSHRSGGEISGNRARWVPANCCF